MKTDFWFLLLSAASAVILVSQWWIYRRLTRQIDEVKSLINELGGIVGAYIDAMEGDGK